MAIPTNEQIYDKAYKEAANIMTTKQIALSAMYELRRLIDKKKKTKNPSPCLTCNGRFYIDETKRL